MKKLLFLLSVLLLLSCRQEEELTYFPQTEEELVGFAHIMFLNGENAVKTGENPDSVWARLEADIRENVNDNSNFEDEKKVE